VVHDLRVARHDVCRRKVPIFDEGGRHAEAAVDVARARRHREGLIGPEHEIRRASERARAELAWRWEIARITLRCALLDPARDHRDLGVREAALADELAIALKGLPRRHGPLLHRSKNLVAPPVDMLVFDQLEGPAAARPVAFLAVPLEQARDVLVERHAYRGSGPTGHGRSGASGENGKQGEKQPEPHAGILGRGNSSGKPAAFARRRTRPRRDIMRQDPRGKHPCSRTGRARRRGVPSAHPATPRPAAPDR